MIRHIVGLDSFVLLALEHAEPRYRLNEGADRDVDRLPSPDALHQVDRGRAQVSDLGHVDMRFDPQLLVVNVRVLDPTDAVALPDPEVPAGNEPAADLRWPIVTIRSFQASAMRPKFSAR